MSVLGYVIEAGDIPVARGQGDVELYEFAFVVKFKTPEDLRQAMIDRSITLSLFPDPDELLP